jgi:hypothetical protein
MAQAAAATAKLSHADAAKKLKDVVVRDHKKDREGKPVLDSEKKVIVLERAPTENDIIAVNEYADRYHVITIDGQKHVVNK